jgi:hypothetical protein
MGKRAPGRSSNRKERVDRTCMWCQKRMTPESRIEMGWSVMTGNQAVCSERCRLLWEYAGSIRRWTRP